MSASGDVLARVEALVRAAEGRGLAALEFSGPGFSLALAFEGTGGAAAEAPASAVLAGAASAETGCVSSPGVGFFRARHPAGGAEARPGDAVGAGAVVGFIQAGPLLQPVVAPRAGVLGARLAADREGVGYGAPLFELA